MVCLMLFADFSQPDTFRPLLTGPSWEAVFDWIERRPTDLADGIYPIDGEEIFVNQHRYETQSRGACRWESHRRYIDLQFCLEGSEVIDVINRDYLVDDGSYDDEKDLLFHRDPEASKEFLSLRMTPGKMAIFTPSDAHRPKVAHPGSSPVRKFVVKICLDTL